MNDSIQVITNLATSANFYHSWLNFIRSGLMAVVHRDLQVHNYGSTRVCLVMLGMSLLTLYCQDASQPLL